MSDSVAKKALADARKVEKRTNLKFLHGLTSSKGNRAPRAFTPDLPEFSELGEYINDIYLKISALSQVLGVTYDEEGKLASSSYSSHTHEYKETTITTTISTDAEGNSSSNTTTSTIIKTTSGVGGWD